MFDLTSFTPYKQATIILGAGLLFMLGSKALQLGGMAAENPERIWVVAATFGLFFSVANCVFSLNVKEGAEKYWVQSMVVFVLTMGILALVAGFISGLHITEAGNLRWIFVVVIISYFVFSSIVRMMKGIVDFAQKEEWNQPNKKKR